MSYKKYSVKRDSMCYIIIIKVSLNCDVSNTNHLTIIDTLSIECAYYCQTVIVQNDVLYIHTRHNTVPQLVNIISFDLSPVQTQTCSSFIQLLITHSVCDLLLCISCYYTHTGFIGFFPCHLWHSVVSPL